MNPKHNLAASLLAALGLFHQSALPAATGLSSFHGQHTANKLRRNQRALCRELGRRQYRRATRQSYTLRDSLTVG